ncbi:DNA-dependent ATPase protein rad54 [Malassezia cuniculi]|uniref:RNA polymerase II transcription factor B subunit 2 n=1 Tax=Malassezia cuniculi TaxID=948313 RepID=A0AAF0J600_9BASI|nr:DNA-dependent ATPase protein rad54 [Malassezia cuniculi]
MRRSAVAAARDAEDVKAVPRQLATGGGYGILQEQKPFKTPSPAPAERTGLRKRTRVNYAGMGGGADDAADENILPQKKSSLEGVYKGIDASGVSLNVDRRKWTVYEAKPDAIHRSFSIPSMHNKQGEPVEVRATNASLGMRRPIDIPPRPLHDPMADHAVVLFDPTVDDRDAEKERAAEEASIASDEPVRGPHKSLAAILGLRRPKHTAVEKVPVVIDPRLGKILRPHQIEGVRFLYRCTTGLVSEQASGCIMADEMGLGKTLQCIALMWTLLRQSPQAGRPTIEKCIIVCPSSLVRNWANELVKWLGQAAPGVLALDGKLTREQVFESVQRWSDAKGRAVLQPVMIASYETLRNLQEALNNTPIGLLLCDEGHRLKNADSLTFQSLAMLNVRRRVILSGTPIQNDLSEYFALLSFAIPDVLGSKLEFHKEYELDILKGRDADATEAQQELGKQKLQQLSGIVSKFIIRRTNDILSKYLPVKYEHVVFCRLSPFQLALYDLFINSPSIKRLLKGTGSQPLKAIGILKKLCNHPDLLDLPEDLEGSEELFPDGYKPGDRRNVQVHLSGKMAVLERFLSQIRSTTNDKIVLISNYTQTLDIFERLLRSRRWGFFRLDGTMNINKRQKLVDRFNDPEAPEFVFLLSSKAGGCGLNLIGANRLVLFDPDWNPASDQQALARVWRDGQKKTCFVYRFIATGSIEEKILQRQSHKQSLSSSVVDDALDAERHFSGDDLRALFLFKGQTDSDTHDTYKCRRCRDGKQQVRSQAMLYGDSSTWNHMSHDHVGQLHDDLLRAELAYNDVSIETFLTQQPRSVLNRLYEKPASCLAVFRLLPMTARQIIMNMLFLDGPLQVTDCLKFFRKEHTHAHEAPLQRMELLSIIVVKGGTELHFNRVFRDGMICALTGAGDFRSFGTPYHLSKDKIVSISDIDEFSRQQWETILHFMVGNEQSSTPRKTVLYLLHRAGLMQRGEYNQNQLSITSAGFQFLLQDVNSQLWVLLLQYLSIAEERNMDLVEVLAFFFTVGSLELGRAYETAGLSPTQLQMLEELSDYGLVYRPGKHSGYFFPTRLATTLTSSTGSNLSMSSDQEEQGYIILETNYRVYAYTGNLLKIAILNLFVTLKSRFPNIVVGQLTRDRVKSALKKGITADQIIAYLEHHAHPQMYKNDPLLPITVTDQIRLWEREMNRVTTCLGNLYTDFTSAHDFEQVREYAQSLGVLQWHSDERRMLFVTSEGHERVREFIQRRRVV